MDIVARKGEQRSPKAKERAATVLNCVSSSIPRTSEWMFSLLNHKPNPSNPSLSSLCYLTANPHHDFLASVPSSGSIRRLQPGGGGSFLGRARVCRECLRDLEMSRENLGGVAVFWIPWRIKPVAKL